MKYVIACVLLIPATAAQAQDIAAPAPATPAVGRTGENAVTQAEDGFGTSIGSEDVGIYNAFDVRGFSPTRAGNIRIDGLYFDQVWGLNALGGGLVVTATAHPRKLIMLSSPVTAAIVSRSVTSAHQVT